MRISMRAVPAMAVISPANVAERSVCGIVAVAHCSSVAVAPDAPDGPDAAEAADAAKGSDTETPAAADEVAVAVPPIAAGASTSHGTATAHVSATTGRRNAAHETRTPEDIVLITPS